MTDSPPAAAGASRAPTTLGLGTKIVYGFGAVAPGAMANGFAYLLLFFYSQVIGLSPELVSLALFVALMFDAVSDPLIGYLSDNFRSRWGRRHPFMYASAVPVALAYYFLWSPPALSEGALLAYLIVLAVVIRIAFTLYDVPANALIAEFTEDYDELTRIVGFRYFFAWWGGLTMAVLAYLVFLPEERGGLLYAQGWRNYGLAASIIMFVAILASCIGTHHRIPTLIQPAPREAGDEGFSLGRVGREIFDALSNRSFLVLFVAALLSAAAQGVSTTLSIYFTRHMWEFTTQQIGVLQFPYYLSAFVALLLAPRLTVLFGKKRAAITIAALAFGLAPLPFVLRMLGLFPENGTDTLFWTMLVFNGFDVMLIICATILTTSMIADVVEDSEVQTGRRNEGVFFAANTFAQKSVNAVGVVVAGQILALVDFPQQAEPGTVPEETVFDLAQAFIPTQWGLYLLAIIMLSLYRISRTSHAENLAKLGRRSAAA